MVLAPDSAPAANECDSPTGSLRGGGSGPRVRCRSRRSGGPVGSYRIGYGWPRRDRRVGRRPRGGPDRETGRDGGRYQSFTGRAVSPAGRYPSVLVGSGPSRSAAADVRRLRGSQCRGAVRVGGDVLAAACRARRSRLRHRPRRGARCRDRPTLVYRRRPDDGGTCGADPAFLPRRRPDHGGARGAANPAFLPCR
jgi:hypothetical protein